MLQVAKYLKKKAQLELGTDQGKEWKQHPHKLSIM